MAKNGLEQSLLELDDLQPRMSVSNDGSEQVALKTDHSAAETGHASIASSIFNLSNTILGSGVLAMSIACHRTGILLLAFFLLGLACISHYSIVLLLTACDQAVLGGKSLLSYTELGKNAFGRKGELLVIWSVLLQQLGACILYIIVIADIFQPIFTRHICGDFTTSRGFIQILIVGLVIFPLCLLRRIDSLQYTSFFALFCIVSFTLLVFGLGCQRLSSYGGVVPSDFNSSSGLPSAYESISVVSFSLETLLAIPTITFAYVCHMNAFPIYAELKGRNIQRMSIVSRASMIIAFLVYFVAGVFGYFIFGSTVSQHSDLLDDLNQRTFELTFSAATVDVFAVAIGMALIFSYPVVVWELRHCMDELIFGHRPYNFRRYFMLNCGIVFSTLILGIFIPNIGVVLGFLGPTSSALIVFLMPACFYLKVRVRNGSKLVGRSTMGALVVLGAGCILSPLCLIAVIMSLAAPAHSSTAVAVYPFFANQAATLGSASPCL